MKTAKVFLSAVWLSTLLAGAQNAHAWAYKAFSELCIYGAAKAPFKDDGFLKVEIQMDVVALCKNVKSAQQCDAGEGNSGTLAVNIPAQVDPTKAKGTVYVGCQFNTDGTLYVPDPDLSPSDYALYEEAGCVPDNEGKGHCISMATYDLHYTYVFYKENFLSCTDAQSGCSLNVDDWTYIDQASPAECAQDADCLFIAENWTPDRELDGNETKCDAYKTDFTPLGECILYTEELPQAWYTDNGVKHLRIAPHQHICNSSDPNKVEIFDTATGDLIQNVWTLYKSGSRTALKGTDVCTWDGGIDPRTCAKLTYDGTDEEIETWTCSETTYK